MNIAFLSLAGLIAVLALVPLIRSLLGADGGSEAERSVRRARAALEDAAAAQVISAEEYQAKLAALPVIEVGRANAKAGVLALAVAVLVPALAFFLYWQLGTPSALQPASAVAPHASTAAAGGAPMDLDSALAKLAERLQTEADDAEGWRLLARGYSSQQRYAEALAAAQKAFALLQGDVDAEVELVEASVLAAPGRQFDAVLLKRLQDILQRVPDHPRALWLSGIAALQAGDTARARTQWTRLASILPEDSEALPGLRQEIAALAGEPASGAAEPPPAASTAATGSAPATAGPGPAIEVQVRVAPAIIRQIPTGATLFVFARPASGSRMPLAIAKRAIGDWPVSVRLDDSSSMMPGMALSNFPEIVIAARISRRGDATPASGDWEASSPTLLQSAIKAPVELLIENELP